MNSSSTTTVGARRRPSITEKWEKIQNEQQPYLTGPFADSATNGIGTQYHANGNGVGNGNGNIKTKQIPAHLLLPPRQGFVKDIVTMRWMRVPSSSIKGVILPVLFWAQWNYFTPETANPFSPMLFLSHRVSGSSDADPRYQKGYLDLVFVAYWVVVFSFIRQFLTLHVFHRLAKWWGIRSANKIDRFGEQGYAMVYFGVMGTWGLLIMRTLPTWYYQTQYFWIGYPHWDIPGNLKQYYLTQSAYWVQQFLVLVLGLERPRSDFTELCIHHLVTLWLIFWSYLINLTLIGNAIYVSMDIPDAFLALSKLLNYMGSPLKTVTFALFACLWTYFRHYLNLVIIKSAWSEFSLMPESSKQWNPASGAWMVWWMQYQVLVPIVLLQMVNLFWYYLIWRIILRALFSSTLDDERSDDEGDDDAKEE